MQEPIHDQNEPEELLYVQQIENQTPLGINKPNGQDLLAAPDYLTIRNNFAKELHAAAANKKSTLSYIRHNFLHEPLVTSGLVQGIVIGGTHYTISTEYIHENGERIVINRQRGRVPVLKDEKVLEKFLREHLRPDLHAIGLSMAFPMKPAKGAHGEIDGIIEYGTKEHTLSGLQGIQIGKWIKEVLEKDVIVAVANDAVCLTQLCKENEQAAFIAATGVNMGIKEAGRVIVNLEAGNFNKFQSDFILEYVDEHSQMRGKNRYEKMAGGKYLPLRFNEMAKYLQIASRVPKINKAHELSNLAKETDVSIANELAREILERSASLVACQIAGLYEFIGRPKHMGLIGEGSLLWKGWEYVNNIQQRLKYLGIPENTVTIRKVSDSSVEGAIGLLIN